MTDCSLTLVNLTELLAAEAIVDTCRNNWESMYISSQARILE